MIHLLNSDWFWLSFFWFDAWILPTLNLLMILTFTFFFSIDISKCTFIENGPKFIPIFPNFLIYFDFPFLFSYLFLTFTVFENGPRIQLILHPSPQPSDWFWLSLALFSLSLGKWCHNYVFFQSIYSMLWLIFLLSLYFYFPNYFGMSRQKRVLFNCFATRQCLGMLKLWG